MSSHTPVAVVTRRKKKFGKDASKTGGPASSASGLAASGPSLSFSMSGKANRTDAAKTGNKPARATGEVWVVHTASAPEAEAGHDSGGEEDSDYEREQESFRVLQRLQSNRVAAAKSSAASANRPHRPGNPKPHRPHVMVIKSGTEGNAASMRIEMDNKGRICNCDKCTTNRLKGHLTGGCGACGDSKVSTGGSMNAAKDSMSTSASASANAKTGGGFNAASSRTTSYANMRTGAAMQKPMNVTRINNDRRTTGGNAAKEHSQELCNIPNCPHHAPQLG